MTSIRRIGLFAASIAVICSPTRVPAAAIPEDVINKAIDRGVAALKKMQGPDGSYSAGKNGSGPTALGALTLLECGVPAGDEPIRKGVKLVRDDCPAMNKVYNLSLAILLLDRLGDPLDDPLIHVLAVRLMEGQTPLGAWTYITPDVPGDEVQKLEAMAKQRAEMKTAPAPADRPKPAPDIVERLKRLEQRRTHPETGAQVDNSNTQFALLGLWVARRHGIPSDAALRRAEAYFRATQNSGRWGYMPNADVLGDARSANTCSGLLGLAIGIGIVREGQLKTAPEKKDGKPHTIRDPMKDPLVQAAMNFVGSQVAEVAATGLAADVNVHRHLYFLWSVERVAMIYSVSHMGGVDWYQAGAAAILQAQQPDGAWASSRGSLIPAISTDVNTCFALLFLKRANFAHDLTVNLKKPSRQSSLHAGGDRGEAPEKAPAEGTAHSSDADALAAELATAKSERQAAILGQLRDGKGREFTVALAHAIPN
ncbi:MAG TPA: hypothetical protein VH120_04240, partial [Gemmataceae bacterium]|nr:hypothetical protein [Gemmataceae bacterium]